jgi:hypothetical protein
MFQKSLGNFKIFRMTRLRHLKCISGSVRFGPALRTPIALREDSTQWCQTESLHNLQYNKWVQTVEKSREVRIRFEVLTAAVMKSSIFWDIMPCSPLEVNGRSGGSRRSVATYFTLVSCLAYSSTLRMEATCSCETSVDFKRTTRRYITEDRTQKDWALQQTSATSSLQFKCLIAVLLHTYEYWTVIKHARSRIS